jgi:putative Mn2+ efflux pump MntP
MALIFGFFQGVLPLLGYGIGSLVQDCIQDFDHWIAFALPAIIGGKMMVEGLRNTETETDEPGSLTLSLPKLVTQALATSIDALVIGIGFAFLEMNIFLSAGITGIVTFFFAMLGLRLGKAIGAKVRKGVEVLGGLVLILIGLKIILEHAIA